MADWYALRVDAWRTFRRDLSEGRDDLRRLLWSQSFDDVMAAAWPQRLGPWGKFGWHQRLVRESDRAAFARDTPPDFEDRRLAATWRDLFLGSACHVLQAFEPRWHATLGITIPESGLLRSDEDREQWALVLSAWVYPQSPPPADLWFLEDVDAYCGLAAPDVVQEIRRREGSTRLFKRIADEIHGPRGEFAAIDRFLELCAVQSLWVYFSDTAI